MSSNDTKTIHILGASHNQLELIKTAQELGYKVLVSDMYPNPPGKELADFFEQANTVDKEKTLAIAEKYKISAICTDQTDVAVTTVAYIADKLKLKGIGYEVAQRFTDKRLMREALEANLPESYKNSIPKFRFFKDATSCLETIQSLFKEFNDDTLIVKPINSQGSKGVGKISSSDPELKNKIKLAFKESREAGILVESFINGYEVAVESYIEDGKVYPLSISKKYHYKSNPCLDQKVEFIGDIDKELEQKLFDLNSTVIKTLGQNFGLNHAEYRVMNNEPYLIETAARGAGSNVSGKIVPFLTQFDTNKALINSLSDIKNEIKIENYRDRYAILEFFNIDSEKAVEIKEINIDPEVYKLSEELRINLAIGDRIEGTLDSRARVGQVIIFSNKSLEDLREKVKKVNSLINIVHE